MKTADKPRGIPITDPARIAAIKAGSKYRDYWEMAGEVLWLQRPPTSNQSEGVK
jgi:hypothetical protein